MLWELGRTVSTPKMCARGCLAASILPKSIRFEQRPEYHDVQAITNHHIATSVFHSHCLEKAGMIASYRPTTSTLREYVPVSTQGSSAKSRSGYSTCFRRNMTTVHDVVLRPLRILNLIWLPLTTLYVVKLSCS
jgi:hypothetical protein